MKEPKLTQKDDVLWYLKKYGNITALEGFQVLFIVDLAGCIRTLRKEYNISDEWIHKTNRRGRQIKYKKYIYEGPKNENN